MGFSKIICHNINLLPFCYVDCLLIGSFCLIPLFRGIGKETQVLNTSSNEPVLRTCVKYILNLLKNQPGIPKKQ
ncbi:hypothetical protein A9498_30590 (plasmid) [Bacillus thuringiensis serovar coreanensis]|nr:hypothetical protein A9498_30590 [Bacillus thuringiensis serovar coreanensis]